MTEDPDESHASQGHVLIVIFVSDKNSIEKSTEVTLTNLTLTLLTWRSVILDFSER